MPPTQPPYQPQPPVAPMQPGQQQYPPFNDHTTWSIVTMVFFMLWCGIAALIYSNGAKEAYRMGDYATAYAKANTSKTWNMIGTGIGIFAYVVILPLMFVLMLIGAANS